MVRQLGRRQWMKSHEGLLEPLEIETLILNPGYSGISF